MAERLGALPLGELHAEDVCAYCGAKGSILGGEGGFDVDLKRTVHPMTLAMMDVCMDTVACERRRYKAKL